MEREPCPVCGMRLGVMVPDGSVAYAWCRSKQCRGVWHRIDKRMI